MGFLENLVEDAEKFRKEDEKRTGSRETKMALYEEENQSQGIMGVDARAYVEKTKEESVVNRKPRAVIVFNELAEKYKERNSLQKIKNIEDSAHVEKNEEKKLRAVTALDASLKPEEIFAEMNRRILDSLRYLSR